MLSMQAIPHPRSDLEFPIDSFKPVQRVQKFQAGLTHLFGWSTELIRLFYSASNPFDSDTYLVGHLKFDCARCPFYGCEALMQDLGVHGSPRSLK
jgi:hypothetical protein